MSPTKPSVLLAASLYLVLTPAISADGYRIPHDPQVVTASVFNVTNGRVRPETSTPFNLDGNDVGVAAMKTSTGQTRWMAFAPAAAGENPTLLDTPSSCASDLLVNAYIADISDDGGFDPRTLLLAYQMAEDACTLETALRDKGIRSPDPGETVTYTLDRPLSLARFRRDWSGRLFGIPAGAYTLPSRFGQMLTIWTNENSQTCLDLTRGMANRTYGGCYDHQATLGQTYSGNEAWGTYNALLPATDKLSTQLALLNDQSQTLTITGEDSSGNSDSNIALSFGLVAPDLCDSLTIDYYEANSKNGSYTLAGTDSAACSVSSQSHTVTLGSSSDIWVKAVAKATFGGQAYATGEAVVRLINLGSTPPNRPPTLNHIADITVTEGETVTFTPTATDPDKDPLTFSYSGWMSSNNRATAAGDAGVYEVTVTVSDGRNGSDSQSVLVRVNFAGSSPDPTTQPLLLMGDLAYQGAFVIPGTEYGESSANYSNGTIEYNPFNHSIFLAGHNHEQAVAEFAIPELVNSTDLNALNTAEAPLQYFSAVLNRTGDGNPQNINRITGMKLFNNQLMVNALEYYDAPADNTNTTLMVRDASSIATSAVEGFFSLRGAAHAAGWISPIPEEWQQLLGGTHISGNADNLPIAGRQSIGPTAFVFDPALLLGDYTAEEIPTEALMDFSLAHRLHDDRYNETRGNDLWNVLSWSVYGFIVPDTRTYLTIGSSGGHEFGIGYKATQDTGRLCGGPCSLVAADNYNYYWLWDVNDMLAVKNGEMEPHEIRPYAYGEFSVPFQWDVRNDEAEIHYIRGASYDSNTGTLYITINHADSRGAYSTNPVIAVYKIN